jgi:hypothetical protein
MNLNNDAVREVGDYAFRFRVSRLRRRSGKGAGHPFPRVV